MTPISTKSGAILLVNPSIPKYRMERRDAYVDIFPYLEKALQESKPDGFQLKITADEQGKTAFETANPDHLTLVQKVFKKFITEQLKVKQNTEISRINHRVITLVKNENKLFLHYVELGEFNSFNHAIENLAKRYPKVGATNEKGIRVLKKHLTKCTKYAHVNTAAKGAAEQLFEYLIKEVDLDEAEKFAKTHNLQALKNKVAAERQLQSNISEGTSFPPEFAALVSSYLPQT